MALTDKIKAIADAIRTKTGMTDVMTLDEMPNKIINIPSGTSGDSGVKKPYIEETYDKDGNLTSAKLVGYNFIRGSLFYGCSKLKLTEIPSEITYIGNSAFSGCDELSLSSLPSGITYIGNSAFCECPNLSITELPSSVTFIGSSAFIKCIKLKSIDIPSNVMTIKSYAFGACTNLTSIRFLGTPTSIDSTTFDGCNNLTTIKVPWSEGAVANAPWGAINATITYDYTGE